MANTSDTSITKTEAASFVKSATNGQELSCKKIKGFKLRKTQAGASWFFRYTDFNGKRKKITLGKYVDGTQDRLSAVDSVFEFKNKMIKGDDPKEQIEQKKRVFRESERTRNTRLLATYLNGPYRAHQARKVNEGKHTLDMIQNHFADFLSIPMDEIETHQLQDWQKQAEDAGKSHATIKRVFGALRTLLRHAVRHGVIQSDPTANFKLAPPTATEKDISLDGSDSKARRVLTREELDKISKGLSLYRAQLIEKREQSRAHGKPHLPSLKNLEHPNWFFPFFHLAAYSGLRTGDLYSLNWNELNLPFRRLVKAPNKTRHHTDPIKVDLPLDDHIADIMTAWYEQQGRPINGLVFPSSRTGNKMDKKAHLKHWRQILALGGITESLDFYALRHHYISKLVAAGVPMFTVARLAGHKSVRMIEQHYGHLAPNAAAEALALISGDFKHLNAKEIKSV